VIDAFAELTLETRDPGLLERFYREAFGFEVLSRDGDRVWLGVGERARLGLWTPGEKEFGEGNVVEVWDFFSRGDGAREGVEALR
jgi:catechol-2,3-dioxygenase